MVIHGTISQAKRGRTLHMAALAAKANHQVIRQLKIRENAKTANLDWSTRSWKPIRATAPECRESAGS